MPRSSRHKSHKQSKHSSKGYSDSEDDVRKVKERTGKDDSSTRVQLDSASGEKRKTSSHVREGRDRKDSSVHGNGEVLEEYVSSKRRKEKSDVSIDGDRWNGGGEEKDISDRLFENDIVKGDSLKSDEKCKDKGHKSENLKTESKSKSKRNEILVTGDRKEEGSASVGVVKEDSKSRSESKRKSDRDSSSRKEGRDAKDKEHRSDKERNGGQVSRNGDDEIKVMVEKASEKKQVTSSGNLVEEKQSKRSRDNTDGISQNALQSPDLEKESEKKIRRKGEGSGEREKKLDDSKEGDERRGSTRSDRLKDAKHKDEKYKDAGYAEKYLEDCHKSGRKKDEKHHGESDKDYKYHDEKFREDGEKDSKRRDYKYREDGDRESRKEEKYRQDGESDAKWKDEKYREIMEDRSDTKRKDGDKNSKLKDDRYNEDGAKDHIHGDDRYIGHRDRDDKHRGDGYGDDGERENKHKDEKHREDFEKDIRRKDSSHGNEIDREKRQRESNYEHSSRDRSGDKLEPKRSIDDNKLSDYHARKSSAYDESPTHDYRTKRLREEQNKRNSNDKEDYADTKSLSTKDQRPDADKKSSKLDSSDRARNASRHSDADYSSHSRRRSSPSSHGLRDNYRSLKQDESKYRDYNHEERHRDSNPSTREHMVSLGGSEKTTSRSLEKFSQGNDTQHPDMSAERRLKSDNHSSPQQRTGSSRDWKEGRGSRDLGSNVVPAEEHLQVDTDTLSVSSPFIKNSNFAGSSRSLPQPTPFRTGVDSPLPIGSAEDDGRTKSHGRNRRFGEPNMGRIQGNAWRGVPTWPSPMPNGFLPYPHAPHHVGFHSVMQPFPAPPMFGLRPPVELNLHSPYHMSDPDRYSGPGRPMGWPNQVDETCPPMHTWDGSGSLYGNEPYIYGRPDWDQSQNITSDDMWKGSNQNKIMERQSFEKENNSLRTGDEFGQSLQPTQGDQAQVDHLAETTDICLSTKNLERNDAMVPRNSLEFNDDIAKKARKEDLYHCRAYLSKLDISVDLAEPELFTKFTGLLSNDQTIVSNVTSSKILYMEDGETKILSHSPLYSKLFPPMDDSILQRSMSLYNIQKQTMQPKDGTKVEVLCEMDTKSEQDNDNGTHIKREHPSPTDDMQGLEDGLPSHHVEPLKAEEYSEQVEQMVGESVADNTEKTEVPVPSMDGVKSEVVKENDTKDKGSLTTASSEECVCSSVKHELDEELKVVDTKFDALHNSEMGSLNRIHHSPESTH